jgi:hypothetical protein
VQLIRRLAVGIAPLLAYAAIALIFHWPLPRQLGSALTGPVSGDTGVYVWNMWVFRHEIVAHRRFPLFTQEVLSLTPPIDLSLHNYTLFADLLAFPLLPIFGVTATFNLIFLAISALTAWAMYLLARHVVGRPVEAWLAGLLFGFSPILVARSTAHFSLVAAAPLPIFALCVIRLERHPTPLNALAAGATMAWAAMCDPYFGVNCVLIAACYAAARSLRIRRGPPAGGFLAGPGMLAVIVGLLATTLGVAIARGLGVTEFQLLGRRIGLSMHSPVVALMAVGIAWSLARFRPSFAWRPPIPWRQALRCGAIAVATCGALLSPLLFAMARRLADGGELHGPIYWRSGPKGVDLLAFFTPNPASQLFGTPVRDWLTGRSNGYVENVAALTIVATLVVALATWRVAFRPQRVWLWMTAFFGLLALGPFITIGGVNTYVLGPWALLRYVPLISAARMPARFAIVTMMAFAVLFALALRQLADSRPERRRLILGAVAVLLAVELAPLPRQLFAAPVPDIFQIIAADPRDVRVLSIPLGIADGERGEGRYDGASQFYQTFHQKPIVGGGLSRISNRERQRQRRFPVIRVLLRLSEGLTVSEGEIERARRAAPAFLRRSRIGYVVVDTHGTSPELRALAIDILKLEKIAESDGRELYRPTEPLDSPPVQ